MGSLKSKLKATPADIYIFYAIGLLKRKGDSTITLYNFCRGSRDILLPKCCNDYLAHSELFELVAHLG